MHTGTFYNGLDIIDARFISHGLFCQAL